MRTGQFKAHSFSTVSTGDHAWKLSPCSFLTGHNLLICISLHRTTLDIAHCQGFDDSHFIFFNHWFLKVHRDGLYNLFFCYLVDVWGHKNWLLSTMNTSRPPKSNTFINFFCLLFFIWKNHSNSCNPLKFGGVSLMFGNACVLPYISCVDGSGSPLPLTACVPVPAAWHQRHTDTTNHPTLSLSSFNQNLINSMKAGNWEQTWDA